MSGSGQENGVQIKHGNAKALEIVQLFPDAVQKTAVEFPTDNIAGSAELIDRDLLPVFFYTAGNAAPDIGKGAHMFRIKVFGTGKTVRKDLIHDTVFIPSGNRRITVYGDLESRRFLRIITPGTSQALRIVAIVDRMISHVDDKIVKQDAGLFRQKKVDEKLETVPVHREQILSIAFPPYPECDRKSTFSIKHQVNGTSGLTGAEGPAVCNVMRIVIKLHKNDQ